uniref:NADH dehydrogenase subunit 4L n=1 Tax=Pinctada albina TaxID=315487 RepID=A0A1S5UZM6_9BIVA|nr:NADH dehydrogenase subunit 4L [Pinctada albina]
MKLGLLLFCFSIFLVCLEFSGKTLVTLMILELLGVSAAGIYALGGGNTSYLFVIFCLMGMEISMMMSVFVGMVRQKGDTRVMGVNMSKGFRWGR